MRDDDDDGDRQPSSGLLQDKMKSYAENRKRHVVCNNFGSANELWKSEQDVSLGGIIRLRTKNDACGKSIKV